MSSEKDILNFVEKNKEIIMPEFSVRLDTIVKKFSDIKMNSVDGMQDYHLKVSELIHNNIISNLRVIIGDYCVQKEKVVILVDNLDKAWQNGADIEVLSNFLFGLLDVGTAIIKDFSRENNWKKPINLALIIFLREDIFALMDNYVPERDKLPIERIIWEDKEILLRVIEERIQNGENIDIWEKFFCKKVNNVDVKEFIIENILPRPRDIITLVKNALGNAISRKHARIEENDLISALEMYSKFALDTLITETMAEYSQIRNFLYELAGEGSIITKEHISNAMNNAELNVKNLDNFISMLCKMSFLGLEVKKDDFVFCYNEDSYRRYSAISKKNAQRNGTLEIRYKIHKAFHTELLIE